MSELLELVKQSLGINTTATARDSELTMLIQAAMEDITRAGVVQSTTNPLVKRAIVTYVKANFGISNPDDKEKFLHSYQLVLAELSLSYKEEQNAGFND